MNPKRLVLVSIAITAALVLLVPSPAHAAGKCKKTPAAAMYLMRFIEPGITVRHIHAVRSGDYKRVYFVAADLQGPGLLGSDDIAVWAFGGSPKAPNGIVTANGWAEEFSSYADGGTFNPSFLDDGGEKAMKCAKR